MVSSHPPSDTQAQHTPKTSRQQYFEQTAFIPPTVNTPYQQFPQIEFSSDSQLEHHAPEPVPNETFQPSYPSEISSTPFQAERVPHSTHTEHVSEQSSRPVFSAVPQYVWGEEHAKAYVQHRPYQEHIYHVQNPVQEHDVSSEPLHSHDGDSYPEQQTLIETRRTPSPQPPPQEEPMFEAPRAEWDASR